MNTLHKTTWGARALAGLLALAATAAVQAQATYNVSLDTSSLLSGPFELEFQFSDGSGVGSGLNWATLSNFQFGGGSAVGVATLAGDAAGDLASTITLGTSDPYLNGFFQEFTFGSSFSFDVSLTTNTPWAGATDLFTFSILPISTDAPNGFSLAEIGFDGLDVTTASYGDSASGIPAPSVTAIPEPATYGLWLGAFLLAAVVTKRMNAKRRNVVSADAQ